jgi:hypothetical protein
MILLAICLFFSIFALDKQSLVFYLCICELGLWCLKTISTIFQLYRGDRFIDRGNRRQTDLLFSVITGGKENIWLYIYLIYLGCHDIAEKIAELSLNNNHSLTHSLTHSDDSDIS